MELSHEYTADVEHRFIYAVWIVVIFFLVVLGRLYYLQILRGEFYRFFSIENSIKEIKIPAVRGVIIDRRGQILIESRPAFDVVVIPQFVADPLKMLSTLSRHLNMPADILNAKWETRRNQPSYQPIMMKEDVSLDEVAKIRVRKGPWYDEHDSDDLRGVEINVRYQRVAPNGTLAPHLIGYVREIDPERLARYQEVYPGRYFIGDYVGMRGLEEGWDLTLRGQDGFEQQVVNAVGRSVNYEGIADQLEQKAAVPGNSLLLTVDHDVQQTAQSLFGERGGAAVMLNVRDGGIIAMYSSPSFDLNRLSSPEGSSYWLEIAKDPKGYLINRTIQGAYPPGSTFKPVTAVAALSEGAIKLGQTVNCAGALMYGGRAYHCWREGGHGAVDIHRAIVESCDVFFYQMGLKLGVDKIAKYARLLGLGQATGIPLSDERTGLIPTSEWKLKRFGIPWQEGETLSVAVGQGYDLATPLQNALVAAYIANGGHRVQPHLVEAAYDANGNEIYRFDPQQNSSLEDIAISKDVLKTVREAMIGVVSESGGTAHRLSTIGVSMGGKTGTAQVIQLDGKAVCVSEKCRDHAWFIGFAPAENPEVAAAVVVEHGGFGASAAAPIVGAMIQKYYGKAF